MDSETLHLDGFRDSTFRIGVFFRISLHKNRNLMDFCENTIFSFYFVYFSLSKYVTTFYIRGIRDGWPFSEMGSLLFILEFVDHMPFICSNSATYFVILE